MLKIEKFVTVSPAQYEIIFDEDTMETTDFAWFMGDNDHKLAERLVDGVSVRAKYRRMMVVYLTINAPFYWWKEFDTYKVGTVCNSCSTMHRIHSKEFTIDDFSVEHLTEQSRSILEDTINLLNMHRAFFVSKNDKCVDANAIMSDDCYAKYKKDLWWQLLPINIEALTCYNQRRTIMLNYEVLANIYKWRRNHKLDEWYTFCNWIEALPYSELITSVKDMD